MGDLKVNEIKTDAIKNQAGTSALSISSAGEVDMVRNNIGLFQVYSNADQNIASNVYTTVALNEKVFDVDSYFDTSTYRYTPQVAGFYHIEVVIGFRTKSAADDVGILCHVYKNGNNYSSSGSSPYLTGSGNARIIGNNYIKSGTGKEIYVSTSSLVHMNGSTDYLYLVGYLYNYTNVSATDNNMIGHSTAMYTYMLGYRVA